jgi:hypothetical protein
MIKKSKKIAAIAGTISKERLTSGRLAAISPTLVPRNVILTPII